MILTHFTRILAYALAFFLFGLISLVLMSVYDFFQIYQSSINSVFYIVVKVLLVFGCAYIGFSAYLSIEYRAISNERFKNDNVELLDADVDDESFADSVLTAYDRIVQATGSCSLNQLALAVFGKKGGHYNNQLRPVLQRKNIYL